MKRVPRISVFLIVLLASSSTFLYSCEGGGMKELTPPTIHPNGIPAEEDPVLQRQEERIELLKELEASNQRSNDEEGTTLEQEQKSVSDDEDVAVMNIQQEQVVEHTHTHGSAHEHGPDNDEDQHRDGNLLELKEYDQETIDQVYSDTPVISQFVYDSCKGAARSGQDPTAEASLRNVGPDRCPYDHWHGTFCGIDDPLGPDCGWGFYDPRETYKSFLDSGLFE